MHVAMGFIRSQPLIRLDYENIDDDSDEGDGHDGDESAATKRSLGDDWFRSVWDMFVLESIDTHSRFQHLDREAPAGRRIESINKFMFDLPVC